MQDLLPAGGEVAATPVAAAADPVVLAAEGVSKHFGGVAAVSNVSFELRRGEILGLIGPNGAGKTTLFDCLAGSLQPSGGRILLAGREVQAEPAHRRLAAGLGRTFQIPRPFPELTVLDNLLLGRQHQAGERIFPNFLAPGRVGREERAARDAAMALLDFVTLAPLAGEPARILSGGQRKLLELARVLMAEPAIILLDEPAAGVNPTLLELIMDRIVEINRRGATLLVVEHNMDVIARLCPRVLVMATGRILAEGAPAAIFSDSRVVDAYLGGTA